MKETNEHAFTKPRLLEALPVMYRYIQATPHEEEEEDTVMGDGRGLLKVQSSFYATDAIECSASAKPISRMLLPIEPKD